MAKKETKDTKKKTDTKSTKKRTSTKSKTKSTSKKKAAPKKTKGEKAVENLTKNTTKVTARKERDMNEMVSVISIVNSPLTYISKREQGYRVEWGGFLEENWMEYKELLNMRGGQRKFFEKPWVICEWDVLEDLRVTQYYKNMIDLDGLDDLFSMRPDELKELLKKVPEGIKDLVTDRAYELNLDGELDSIGVIEAIEEVCDIELTV